MSASNKWLSVAQLLSYVLVTISAIKVIVTNLQSSMWWLGLLVSLPIVLWICTFVWRGLSASYELGSERLALNLGEPGVLRPVTVRALLLAFVLLIVVPTVFWKELELATKSVSTLLHRDTNILRVEYPSYLEKPALESEFTGQTLDVDTGALLQMQLQNESAKVQISGPDLNVQFMGSAEASSVTGLYQRLNIPQNKPSTLTATVTIGDKKQGELILNVVPVPRPIVTLERTAGQDNEKLVFAAKAESIVPMSNVTLEVRTKSGFRFSRTLAEFANSQQHEFKTESANVSTIGIPFASQDSLFVKAVARTVVSDVVGESPEIEIKITTPQEVREKVLKDLTATLDVLKKQDPLTQTKQSAATLLQSASESAQGLGRMSPVKKHIASAMELNQNMEQNSQRQDVEKSVKRAIAALQKEKSKEQAANLFARLQGLQRTVSSQNGADLDKLSAEAGGLANEFDKLKEQMRDAAKSSENLLSPDEKQSMMSALKRDKTSELLKQGESKLKGHDRPGADAALSNALQQASANIGEAARIMEMAKARAMQLARKKLSAADAQLQDAKESKSTESNLNKAKESLSKMPQISKEFGEHADDALKYAKKAQSEKTKTPSIEKSQQAIVEALEALQDQEESEKESNQQREESSRNLDILTAQGQTDSNWRKKILEEIARLRAGGAATDAPMIQYFEDQLR